MGLHVFKKDVGKVAVLLDRIDCSRYYRSWRCCGHAATFSILLGGEDQQSKDGHKENTDDYVASLQPHFSDKASPILSTFLYAVSRRSSLYCSLRKSVVRV